MRPAARISKPPSGTPLNRSCPLAAGLVMYFPFNEGLGHLITDLVSQRQYTITNHNNAYWTTWTPTSNYPFTAGVYAPSNTSTARVDLGAPNINGLTFKRSVADQLTFAVRYAQASGGSGYYFGQSLSGSDIQVALGPGSNKNFSTYNDSNVDLGNVAGTSGGGIYNRWATQTLYWDSPADALATIRTYQHSTGLNITHDTATPADGVNADQAPNANIFLFDRIAGGVPLRSFDATNLMRIDQMAWWNRAVTQAEMEYWFRNPFCLFR